MSAAATPLAVERLKAEDVRAGGRLPRAVRVFWVVSLLAFGLSCAVSWMEFRAGFSRTRWFPLSEPLLCDLMEYPGTYQVLHTAAFFTGHGPGALPYPMFSAVAYPPFAAALIAPLYLLGNPIQSFFLFASGAVLVGVLSVRQALLHAGTGVLLAVLLPASLLLISFPVLRLMHQGNIEIVVWAFGAGGVWAFFRGRENAAAALWGLAAATKLFPVLLLLLLLPRRRYRALLLGLSVFVAVTALSLWWLGPSVAVAWHGSLQNVFGYQNLRASEWDLDQLAANHSLFMLVKFGGMIARIPLAELTVPYYVCSGLLLLLAFSVGLRKMPVANQLLGVTVAMVLVPSISYYHTLVHLYAPLLALVLLAFRARESRVEVRGLQGTMLLFVPLFVPYTLLTFPHAFLLCGLLQSITLLALFVCALHFRFEVRAEDTRIGSEPGDFSGALLQR